MLYFYQTPDGGASMKRHTPGSAQDRRMWRRLAARRALPFGPNGCGIEPNPEGFEPRARCVFADGFSVSVQAHRYVYSERAQNAPGWESVELGFPTDGEIPSSLKSYQQGDVFPYVPAELIPDLVALHGAVVSGHCPILAL